MGRVGLLLSPRLPASMCVFIVLQECVFAGQLKPGKHNNRVAGGRAVGGGGIAGGRPWP